MDSLYTGAAGPFGDFALWRAIGALLLVLLLLVGALYLLRRLQRSGVRAHGGRAVDLEIVGQLPLAPKQFVSVVRVGDKHWVLGVTEQSIRYIGDYEGDVGSCRASRTPKPSFSGLLERAVARCGKVLARSQTEIPEPGRYLLEGLGDEELIGCPDFDLIDDMIRISDRDAFLATRELARTEGIFGGGSSGAALWGVRRVAQRRDRPVRIVTLFPDSGFRYLSTIYNDDWMRSNGFL